MFEENFTNIFADGEVAAKNPDAESDFYHVTDAQQDHNYWWDKMASTLIALSNDPTKSYWIIYGGAITDGGGGTINVAEAVCIGMDNNSKPRIFKVPAQTGVALPSGWNNNRQIWVVAKYDYKYGAATRNHYVGTSYHYQLEDTYYGDADGYASGDATDQFVDSDPGDTVVCLGSFKMNVAVFADLSSAERTRMYGLEVSSVNTDTIDEKTTAAGVTIEGVLLKDNEVSATTSNNCGIYGSAVCYGVYGVASCYDGVYGCSACGAGVRGESGGNFGVLGYSVGSYAICGETDCCYGVRGTAGSCYGVNGNAACNIGMYGCAACCYGVCATAGSCYGVNGYAACNIGVYGNVNCCYGVYGNADCYGVHGCISTTRPVSGNGAYFDTTSSKYLKYKEDICITECLKQRPLKIYKYLWEDTNQKGWDMFIGPMAEDYQYSFGLTSDREGLFQPAGTALGLAIELLERIEKLEEKIKILEAK